MKNITLEHPANEGDTWFASWRRFWFAPADAIGLHLLRVMTGLILLLWLLPLASDAYALFGYGGFVNQEVLQAQSEIPEDLPPVGWSIFFLAGESASTFYTLFWLSIVVIALFTFGVAVRITSILAWIITASFLYSPVATYDADHLLLIPTLYLMVGYVFYGQFSRNLSPLERVVGTSDAWLTNMFSRRSRDAAPSHAATYAVRLFQVHFAIVVLTSFLHKTQMPDWWAGVAFFYPLHTPYQTTIDDLRALAPQQASYFFWLGLAQYVMLAWQLAFPFIAWKRSCRWVVIGGGVIAWIGSVFLFGLPLFGPIYLMACLSYLTPEEWRRLTSGLERRPAVNVKNESSVPRPRALKEVKQV